jgi:alkanesulfonate monooxygenase SsuD/methylene tetrahydromethanopterin reductase-like flavin-dependent oxidoreductase (luciferase family)
MKFGVGLWGMQATRSAPRHHVRLYEELIEDCQIAEDLGFESIWLTEHHFWYDGYCPSLPVTLGAMAAATRRIRVATGLVLLPMHDPLRVAEQIAVADLVSNGRVILGIGNGYRDVEFDGFGLRRKDRGERLTEQLEILTRAFLGERFSFQGKHFRYQDVVLTPKPVQKPFPPIVLGSSPAFAPAVRRAGRFGVGLLLPPTLTASQCREAIRIWEDEARRAGHDPAALRATGRASMGILSDTWVDETPYKAVRVAPHLHYLYREQLGGWRFLVDQEGKPVAFDRPDILNSAVDGAVKAALIGSPAKVLQGLRRFEEAGIDFFCARIRWDSLPRPDLHRCMKLLANEVAVAFA